MSIKAQPSMPNEVDTTRFRPANRRRVQATISSGVDASAISPMVAAPCVSMRVLSRAENEEARRTLPAGFTEMRVSVEPSGRPVGGNAPHTTTGHGAGERRLGGTEEPGGFGGMHNHT